MSTGHVTSQESLAATLPPPQRIALAYAPGDSRARTFALFAFDAHCARLIRQAREPMLAQMRLAWWREMLEADPSGRPEGDPLLESLSTWRGEEEALAALVVGWEHLLGQPPLSSPDFDGFAAGRAGGFAALARLIGAPQASEVARRAGMRWALADLSCHLGDARERECVLSMAKGLGGDRIVLPRALRPLAVLDGLARRSIGRGGAPLLADRMSALVALRLGMTGR